MPGNNFRQGLLPHLLLNDNFIRMDFSITKTVLAEILELRSLFLKENNFQIRYNATHERGWSDSYLFKSEDSKSIGYGSIKGKEEIKDRDAIFEFYVVPTFRHNAPALFEKLVASSGASFIECQTNEPLLTSFLQKFGKNIGTDAILFGEGVKAGLKPDGAIFRKRRDDDVIFEHKAEPGGTYVVEFDNTVVATGGYLTHYNFPYADIYMEVKESERRKGFGSFLVQEVKKQCYINGRVPAARTGPGNLASKATLLKAGMNIVGEVLVASL